MAERSDRFAVTLALLVAGGTGVVLGGLVGMGASNTERADRVRAVFASMWRWRSSAGSVPSGYLPKTPERTSASPQFLRSP